MEDKARSPSRDILSCLPQCCQQVLHQELVWGIHRVLMMKHASEGIDPSWLWNPGQMSSEIKNMRKLAILHSNHHTRILKSPCIWRPQGATDWCVHFTIQLTWDHFLHQWKTQYPKLSQGIFDHRFFLSVMLNVQDSVPVRRGNWPLRRSKTTNYATVKFTLKVYFSFEPTDLCTIWNQQQSKLLHIFLCVTNNKSPLV